MDWRERFIERLQIERKSVLLRIKYFGAGQCRMIETLDGERHDVTEGVLIDLRGNLAEIESILNTEGAPLDA